MIKRFISLALLMSNVCYCAIVPEGSPNQLFGTNGQVSVPVATPAVFDSLSFYDRQSQGPSNTFSKNIILGASGNSLLLMSMLPDGTLEQNFGSNGIVIDDRYNITTAPTGTIRVASMVIESDTIAVTASNNDNGNILLYRYNFNGTPQSPTNLPPLEINAGSPGQTTGIAFRENKGSEALIITANTGANGGTLIFVRGRQSTVVSPTFPFDTLFNDIKIQHDGKIVVAGTADFGASTAFLTARFLQDGQLDTTFNNTGYHTTAITQGSGGGRASTLAIQGDGKVVVTGVDSSGALALVRYLADGQLDASFATQGVAFINFPTLDSVRVNIQSDGKIDLNGTIDVPGNPGFYSIRVNSNGTPDLSIGSAGIRTTRIFGEPSSLGGATLSAAPQTPIRIRVIGSSSSPLDLPRTISLSTRPTVVTASGTSGNNVVLQQSVTTIPFPGLSLIGLYYFQ